MSVLGLKSFGLALSLLLLLLVPASVTAEERDYKSSDQSLTLHSNEEFDTTFNPHAILALQTPDKIIVLVTTRPKEYTTKRIYDGAPFSFPEGTECTGRVLLSVDGEEAPTFLVEGMFPPDEAPTHSTLYTIVNHGDTEYTIMIHYPIEMEQEGFEWAADCLNHFTWEN